MHLPHLAAVNPRLFKDITTALLDDDAHDLINTYDIVAAWPRAVHALAVAGALMWPDALGRAAPSISAAN